LAGSIADFRNIFMADKEIVRYPDDVLRKHAKEVSKVTPEIKKLAKEMMEIMHASGNGVGLAANQIGVLQRIFVYDDGENKGAVINPKITSAEGEQTGPEGCLSVPGLQGEVMRANQIVMKGLNADGKPVKIKAEGFFARILQHEFDHLNGTLFIDRAEPDTLEYITAEDEEAPVE
jgi:peptide deformylase